MTFIDITMPLHSGMPAWPGSPGVELRAFKSLENGDACNNSCLFCDVHAGTHVDAPSHFLKNGATVDRLDIDLLNGPADVVSLQECESITAKELERNSPPEGSLRLLLRTRNSDTWMGGEGPFPENPVALTNEAAQWLVRRGIRLIGIDSLSISSAIESEAVHRTLLERQIIIVEGLNLRHVRPGPYELICLPLLLAGAEGAPARALLRPLPANDTKESLHG